MNVAAILKEKGTGVTTIRTGALLSEAAHILAKQRIGAVVVLGAHDEIAGILSERDIVCALGGKGGAVLGRPVDDFMTRNVVGCTPTDTVAQLMEIMTNRRLRHLPVLVDGRLSGIVSIGDVVKQRILEAEREAEAMRTYIATA